MQVRQVAGNWTIVDDAQLVLDFGASKPNADRAKDIIARYWFDRICYFGRPHPPMMYFTVNGHAPSGAMAGEDAIAFDLAGVVAQQLGGSWIVTDGLSRLLDFGNSKADALQAVTIIKALRLHASVLRGPPERPDDVLQNVSPRAGFVS
jgi:hypothetical protein